MKFISSKRFSPVASKYDLPDKRDLFYVNPKSIPKNAKDKQKFIEDNEIVIDIQWWRKQKDRCLNGFYIEEAIEPGGDYLVDGVDCFWSNNDRDCYIPQYDLWIYDRKLHITGRHYFYLNFWIIYGTEIGGNTKKNINPRFLAMDYFFFRRIDMMYLLEKDDQELKARQLGFSEKIASILAWNYTFVPASFNVVVGGQEADAKHTFDNAKRGLDYLVNTQFYLTRRIGGDNDVYLESKVTESKIQAITAKDNDQAISRFSPYFVVFEEVGKGKKGWSIGVANYVKPSIYAEGRKTGHLLYIGTGGDMEDGVADLETRCYEPDKYNLLSFRNTWVEDLAIETVRVGHFTPRWWYCKLDIDGNPLKAESIIYLEEQGEKEDSNNKTTYWSQQPIYLANVFTSSHIGYFGKEAINTLNRRYGAIKSRRELQIVKKGRLVWKNHDKWGEGVKLVEDEQGWLQYIEEPKRDTNGNVYTNLYFSGLDSYDQDEALTSNSKGAMIVRKMFMQGESLYNCTIAMLIERPTLEEGGAERFYEMCLMTSLFYGCQVNIEYSNLRIFDYFKNKGFEFMLMERPELAMSGMVISSQAKNRYGTDKALKPQILAIKRDKLTDEYVDRMYFLDEIKALATFRYDPSGKKYNCDITIASCEAEVAAKENEHYTVISVRKAQGETKKRMVVYRMENGILVPKYI